MKLLLFVFFSLSSILIFGQTPGNIGTVNLTAWFKPDALTIGNVNSWSTTFPIGTQQITVTDASAPFPQATNTPTGNISNYNKTLFFNNNSNSNLQALTNTNSLSLLQNNSTGAEGTFFCAYYFPSGNPATNNHMMLYNNGTTGIQFRNLGATGRLAIGNSFSNSTNACRNWNENFTPSIISYKGNRTSATSFKTYENDLNFTTNSASQSSGPNGLYIGTYPGNGTAPYNGYLHEYIFFDTDLSDADMLKVHSYLAIKYGITLENSSGGNQGDYLSTDSTVIWDASVSPTYHNDVIGIGRDDDQALVQKQSHSFSDNYRIYIDTLKASNDDNLGVFNDNISFLTMGQTTFGSCGTSLSNAESPLNVTSRIEKEWKVTNTNFNQTFSWDVQIDTCSIPSYLVGNVDIASVRFLVDTDGDFTNATVFDTSSNINIAYANGYITVSGISNLQLPEDSTRYFTIGFETASVTFTGTNSICAGDSVLVTVNVLNVLGPIDLPYFDGASNDTLFSVSDGYTFYVTPLVTTTYIPIGYSSFMDCCGTGNGSSLTISVTPYPNVATNINPTNICLGDSIQMIGLGATTYVWNGGLFMDSTYQSPTSTTAYTLIGTDTPGCSDTTTITVTVNPNPVVSATASNMIICSGSPVTLNGTGALNYAWTNGVANNISFNPLSTSTYTVTGTDTNGCSDTASITVTVNNSPNVNAIVLNQVLCEGESTTVFAAGALTYSWNNGVTSNVPFTPTSSSVYVVTGTDANNCQGTDSVFITVNNAPNLVANASPNPLCRGGKTRLLATGANSYIWSSGTINGDSITLNNTTTITVIGTSIDGCMDTTTVTVSVNPNPIVTANANPQIVCAGMNTFFFGQGATTYTWSGGVFNNQTFIPTTTSTYTVTGIDDNGCIGTDDITLTLAPNPTFSLGPDTVTCPQEPITIYGPLGYTAYFWNTNETTDFITVGNLGTVELTVFDANGCTATDNLILKLADNCSATFNLPNVFTPNSDNSNDFFFIDATNIAEQTITIFNRWGNIMFNETSIQPVWDGMTNKGTLASDGVYYIKYTLKAIDGAIYEGTSYFQLTGRY